MKHQYWVTQFIKLLLFLLDCQEVLVRDIKYYVEEEEIINDKNPCFQFDFLFCGNLNEKNLINLKLCSLKTFFNKL
jgi:hypothetical protein